MCEVACVERDYAFSEALKCIKVLSPSKVSSLLGERRADRSNTDLCRNRYWFIS